MDVESGIQIDIVGALRRRAVLIAAVAGGIFLAAYWIAMALPNEYEAYATLLVQPQSVSERVIASGASDTNLNERLHLMAAEILSRPRLSRVIDELKLYRDEESYLTRQEIIDLMQEQVQVAPVLPELEAQVRGPRREIEINTFRIIFRSDNKQTAAIVAQRLANDFIEEHIEERVEFTQKSLAFISAEQQRLVESIGETDAQIAKLKDEHPGSLPQELAGSQRRLERASTELREAQRKADIARSDEAFWKSQAIEAASIGAPNDDASPARRLQVAELNLTQLRSRRFTEKHPDIVNLKQEIAELSREIESEAGATDAKSMNTAQRTALAEKNRATGRVASANAEIARLKELMIEIETAIGETPRVAEQLDSLHRQIEDMGGQLSEYNNRQLEADVQANLERKQLGEQFRIIEPAFPPEEPTSPNRILILLMGLFMGLGLGVGGAVIAEATDPSMHNARDLQAALGVPVLAAIPAIQLESDRVAQRRQRVRMLAVATVVVFFCLIGGAVTYLFVNGNLGGGAPAAEEQANSGARPASRG